MTGVNKTFFSYNDLDDDDDEDTPELEIVDSAEAKIEENAKKFKTWPDVQVEDKIKSYEDILASGTSKNLKIADGGDKIIWMLEALRKEKQKREERQSSVVIPAKQHEDASISNHTPGLGKGGTQDGQRRCGTRSMSQTGPRGFGSCSSVKTGNINNKSNVGISPGPAPNEGSKFMSLNNGKRSVSFENSRQPSSPEDQTPATKRSRTSSGEQAGPSGWDAGRPSRADQLEVCSNCCKSSNLSSVPESGGLLLCSLCRNMTESSHQFRNLQKPRPGSSEPVESLELGPPTTMFVVVDGAKMLCLTSVHICRRKSKTPDPAISIDSDLQTPAAKSADRSLRNRRRKADVIGRTPDTAMKIDSSDDDEDKKMKDAFNLRSREQSCRSGLLKRRMEAYRVAYPSRDDPEAVEILASDLQRLDPLEFLNDTVIDFYIKYIQRPEFLSPEGKQRFHFFNSFFYKKLSEVVSKKKKKGCADFSKLRKWTKGINIFEKDYLFVPVHDKLHWSLAIICFPGFEPGKDGRSERCILHLDSMSHGHNCAAVFRLLRSYLVAEWKHSVEAGEYEGDECIHTLKEVTTDTIPAKKVPVPLQENESDCGLFLLHYIQRFVENAPKTLNLRDLEGSLADVGVLGREWFLPAEASSLRTSIQEQLQTLFEIEEEKSQEVSRLPGICEVVLPRDLEPAFE